MPSQLRSKALVSVLRLRFFEKGGLGENDEDLVKNKIINEALA